MTTVARTVRTSPVWPVLVGVGLLAGITAAALAGLSRRRRADCHRTARPRPRHQLRTAVRARRGGARSRGGRRVVPACGVPGAAAVQRGARRGGISGAAHRNRRVRGVDGVRGAAGAADRLRCHRAAAGQQTEPVVGLVGCQPDRDGGHLALDRPVRRRVTVVSIPVLRWSWTPLLFAGALVTLVPIALSGHSSAGGSHDLATNSLLIHLIVGAVWAGGSAGPAGARDARGRARRHRVAAVLRRRAVVLRGDGVVGHRQRVGSGPSRRPVRRRLRLADRRQGASRSPCWASWGSVSGAAESLRCKTIRAPAAR